MCGITGLWEPGKTGSEAYLEARVRSMANRLLHRGPDDEGVWTDANAGLAFGHRRLSIIDLSPLGHQPMLSASGRYVVVFNGELYNFTDLRVDLEGQGHVFRGHSDTEVLLAEVERVGIERAVEKFNGMFAIALWDRREQTLTLARDPFGEKPLYYCRVSGGVLFGSELKALAAHPNFRGEIDREALTLYMRHGYVPGPWSIYRGVCKLPPGHLLTIRDGLRELEAPKAYWSAKTAAEKALQNPFRGTEAEATRELELLLKDAIGLRMVSDVPLGAFLSGGIDSSTVVALMQAQSARPVKTFTIGFREQGFNEAEDAAAVARHLGTEHTELYLSPNDIIGVIPQVPHFYDEPFADSSQLPTYLVSQLARRQVTVSLSGDGGDELFGGYNRYAWERQSHRAIGWAPLEVRRALAGVVSAVSPERWDMAFEHLGWALPSVLRQRNPGDKLHKLADVLRSPDRASTYLSLISSWQQPEQVVLQGQEPRTLVRSPAKWVRAREYSERFMYLDTVTYLPDDILVKLDRAAMAVSLEGRVPLLDTRVFDFAWRLPWHFRVRGQQGKWLLRKVLYRYVPQKLVERPKTGFGVPLHAWLRGPLRSWVEDLLSEERLKREGFLDSGLIRKAWKEHLSGARNWQSRLWTVLMFQSWLDRYNRARAS